MFHDKVLILQGSCQDPFHKKIFLKEKIHICIKEFAEKKYNLVIINLILFWFDDKMNPSINLDCALTAISMLYEISCS